MKVDGNANLFPESFLEKNIMWYKEILVLQYFYSSSTDLLVILQSAFSTGKDQ